MSRDPRLSLEDIRDCCLKTLRYTEGMTFESFTANELTFDAVMRNLEIIGEAVRQLSDEVKQRHPEVEWRSIAGFRDIAIHAYATVDEEIVWDIVRNKVSPPLGQVQSILLTSLPGDEHVN